MHIELRELSIGFKNPLLHIPLNLTINSPQLCVIYGNNGCGKTTLIKTLARLINPLSGYIFFNQQDVFKISDSIFPSQFAFLFTAHPFLMNHTVQDIIALGRMPYLKWNAKLSDEDQQTIEHYAKLLDIQHLLSRPANQISDGQFQKTLLAKTLVQQTPVIIFDEPLNHLDFPTKKDVLQILKKIAVSENKIILLSSHDIHLCNNYADSILLIHQNEWAFQTTETMLSEKLYQHFLNQ